MPSAMRCFVSYLLGAMTVFCLACRLSLCMAIFGSDFRTLCSFISCMMYIRVYIVVSFFPPFEPFLNPSPHLVLFILFCISVSLPLLAGWCCLHLMCVWLFCFVFSHKVHCNLKKYVFILSFKFPTSLI